MGKFGLLAIGASGVAGYWICFQFGTTLGSMLICLLLGVALGLLGVILDNRL